MVIVMLGAPGAGKGTIGKALAKKINAKYIATGDAFREIATKKNTELAVKIRKYMDKGMLVPDELSIKIFMEELLPKDLSKNIILDGYPRTVRQAKHFDNFLKSQNMKVDAAINIDVTKELIIDRIVNRRVCPNCKAIYNLKYGKAPKVEGICDECGEALVLRTDDNEYTVNERLEAYDVNTKPLVNYYKEQNTLKNIQATANKSISELVDEAINCLKMED